MSIPSAEHWYLDFLGVEPRRQGRGLGKALLSPALERCDRERIPAYLGASTERNRMFYERNGFALTEVFDDAGPRRAADPRDVEGAGPMMREGSGEPLVLLHGILGSEAVWRHVMPLLADEYDVVALTIEGHHGGPRPVERPVTIET